MIDNLSLPELVAQMFVVRASGYLFDHQIRYRAWEPTADKLRYYLENLGVGGVILVGGSAAELAVRSHQLQSWAKFPLLLAADIEEGVGQRFAGATWFGPPMAIAEIARHDAGKADRYAEQMGAVTAIEARAIGLNWILAPVVDVNNNPDNPVINVRAFGETSEIVGKLASAFIRGALEHPILTTAKHFPGHGDTAVDSHLELPVLPHSPDRLAEIELPPFVGAIAAGVDAVMSAHLLIPAWDDQFPATLSRKILIGKLREELGFDGLIVTDALVMGAIANKYGANEAAVLAAEAGADVLLMPLDPEGAILAVCEAVTQGRLDTAQIKESVNRIWKAKIKVGLSIDQTATNPKFDPPQPPLSKGGSSSDLILLATAEARATAADILRDSLKFGGALPLVAKKPSDKQILRNLIVVDDVLGCEFLGKHTPAIAIPEQFGYELQLIDDRTGDLSHNSSAEHFSPTLLQIFIRGNCFRGSAGLTQAAQDWFKNLLKTGELQAVVVYGSPYVLEQFLPHLPPTIPYIFCFGQMPAAQSLTLELLFGINKTGNA
ncbi:MULTISPECIES: glycoside hydrolase family 3 N-terminal domain-containing protein [unclassified Microcoleus]|uniref:glycoside hydrolase family 3 protein n=1 Tax=unclassified Microcoleus TaxID=2642155 RepID=UPI001DB48BD3|nr:MULTISPECIES: glycoside hydrolase family 3 N-terminal domain-containing protein [unclassified Microcoleus]TAE16263.1 MAG: beta-glucosidase [Oscillatoriales cyanobacterium]MCC3446421.1 beta-glucosidase [Microcoleus sp. PH2017_09_SFU_O_A]MCC3471065.1 beta-glucosidase [Microcoleus sp. PH2017_13_LAR_U_A]MCC3483721.1 beta-glucosidase [Microcoleus sp. PH2017_14_LAR_D_A]MCC3489557.1 beta-glucosidase [Microcoleus sp. PH2017_16_JOR_D_A]